MVSLVAVVLEAVGLVAVVVLVEVVPKAVSPQWELLAPPTVGDESRELILLLKLRYNTKIPWNAGENCEKEQVKKPKACYYLTFS